MDLNIDKKMNYRELQAIAKKLQLPGNLKHHLLLEIIQARKEGNEDLVAKILSEQKLERAKRRSEKLEGKDAGYKHLNIFQEKKNSLGRMKRSYHKMDSQEQINKMKNHSVQDSYLRSLLALPHKSLRELMIKTQQESVLRSQQMRDTGFSRDNYQQLGANSSHCSTNQLIGTEPFNNPIVINEFSPKSRYENKASVSDGNMRNEIIGYKQSEFPRIQDTRPFQTRPELNEHIAPGYQFRATPNHNMGQNNMLPKLNIFPQVGQSEYSYVPPSNQIDYLPMQHCQDGSFMNCDYWKRIPERGNFQTAPTPNTNYLIEQPIVCSPNSDTLSATETELEQMVCYNQNEVQPDFRNCTQLYYPPVYNYVVNGNQQGNNLQTQDNQIVFESEVQDYSFALQPIQQTTDPLYSPAVEGATSADVTLVNVIDHQEYREWSYEYTTADNCLNYVHGISQSSYIQLM
ncbi:uncharacterized protein LOC106661767 isoform X2 [Cimex lectularius]|uniref:Uncharacterized protein n=1 Tax=Cimex lectularius TaxID=79782 RepID=A0A8I6RBL7_CIMLE|nr:uncharacterized protein LOC106661767 isoform X2 [Cimex lectularius]